MAVTRCTCHDVPFDELKRLHDDQGMSLRDMVKATRCGTGCGLCVPYIRLMMRTGRTELPVLSPQELRTAVAS